MGEGLFASVRIRLERLQTTSAEFLNPTAPLSPVFALSIELVIRILKQENGRHLWKVAAWIVHRSLVADCVRAVTMFVEGFHNLIRPV